MKNIIAALVFFFVNHGAQAAASQRNLTRPPESPHGRLSQKADIEDQKLQQLERELTEINTGCLSGLTQLTLELRGDDGYEGIIPVIRKGNFGATEANEIERELDQLTADRVALEAQLNSGQGCGTQIEP